MPTDPGEGAEERHCERGPSVRRARVPSAGTEDVVRPDRRGAKLKYGSGGVRGPGD
mgnify:CR=1 FL=1